MSQSTEDLFRKKLEDEEAGEAERALDMEFEGFPCKVLPVPFGVYISSGRMPSHLADIMLDGVDAKAAKELTGEDVIEGERFKRTIVCRILVSPRVVAEGEPPSGGYLYADLVERAPGFVAAVFRWFLLGCPKPKGEGGEVTPTPADLAHFPNGERQGERAGAGDSVEARGAEAI